MRGIMIFAVAVVLCLQPMGPAQSQDEARAIIGKAIKAMGVDKEPENSKGLLMKSKGTLEAMGMTLNISQTVIVLLPDQFKEVVELEVNNMKIPITTVYDGKKSWVVVNNGKAMKLDDKINAELKEVANLMQISKLKPLLKKEYVLALTGEIRIEDNPALGVRVSTKGAKDVTLFFDKKSGVLTKMDRQAYDAMTGQEVQEERIIRSYKDKGGRKVPHEVAVLRDGKKFVEVEVIEFTPLDNVDPGEFTMPD